MQGEMLDAVAGEDFGRTQQLRNTDGTPFTLFAGSETFACSLWPGDDQAPITPAPTAAWVSAPLGTYRISYPRAATLALAPGRYRLLVEVVAGGLTFPAFVGGLRVAGRPGSASPFKGYCTVADMRKQYAKIESLMDPDSDVTGFGEQIQEARDWIERLGQRHYRVGVAVDPYRFVALADGLWRTGRDNVWLKGQFDADALIVTRDVRTAAACYACSLVLLAQADSKEAENYRRAGRRLAITADALASLLTLQLDTNGDGTADVAISLGRADRIDG